MSWALGDNALAYWPCDVSNGDEILDQSGNGKTLTGNTYTSPAYRNLELADTTLGGFPKAVDYTVGRQASTVGPILPNSSGDWTVACWVYLSNYSQSNWIWSQGASGGTDRTMFAASHTGFSNNIRFYNEDVQVNGSTLVPLLTWTHLAARCVSGTVTIYLNGSSAGSVSGLTGVQQTSFVWGAYGNDGNNRCDALVTGKIVTADVTTPITDFMAGPPRDNTTQIAFDNEVIGGNVTFARSAKAIDAQGISRGINQIRYGKPGGLCDPVEWTSGHVFTGAVDIRVVLNGTNADGEGLTLVRCHTLDEGYVVEGASATVTATFDITGDDFMDGAESPVTYTTYGGGVAHLGAVVVLCERRSAGTTGSREGISLVWTDDNFATRNVIDLPVNALAAGGDAGMQRTQNYAMGGVFKDPDYPLSLRAWLPFSDYLSASPDRGGQAGLALLYRDSESDPWQLDADIIQDYWQAGLSAGYHIHGSAITWKNDGTRDGYFWVCSGDTDRNNWMRAYPFTFDSDWKTNSVGTPIEHGDIDTTGTGSVYPSPQPTNLLPGPDLTSMVCSGDETAQLIAKYALVDASEMDVVDLRYRHTRNATGGRFEGPAPIHAEHVPGIGYVSGGGNDQFQAISDDGEIWAEYNRPDVGGSRGFVHGGKLLHLDDITLYTADRPVIRTYRPAQVSHGGTNELSAATATVEQGGYTHPAENYLVKVYYDQSDGLFKYVSTDATYGHVADAAIPVQPLELPPVDLSQDLSIFESACIDQDYRCGSWRLNVTAPDKTVSVPGVLRVWACNVSAKSQSMFTRLQLRTGGGADSGTPIAIDLTRWRRWMPYSIRITSGSSGFLYMEVFNGNDNALDLNNRKLFICENYTPGTSQPGYYAAPRDTSPDELLTIPAEANMGNFSARIVWRIPEDVNNAVETQCVALIYADANNYVRITQEQDTPGVGMPDTFIAAEVFVGGVSVGSAQITGDAWMLDTIDFAIQISGRSLTVSGRGGFDAFATDTDTLTDTPTLPIVEIRHRDTDDTVFPHEVLGVATGSGSVDVTDIAERNTLAIRAADEYELIVD